MTGSAQGQPPKARIVRTRQGRLLGGVCAGLPDTMRLGTNGLRLLFVLASFLGGIGVVLYLTCWLVIPAEDQDPENDPVRAVVLLAWATGALVTLVLIGCLAAAATIFGLGWIVLVIAVAVASLSISPLRSRIPRVAVLLILTALTLPAMAIALSPMRLTFQSGQTVVHPRSYKELSRTVYRSGFGTLLIDLRKTPVHGATTTLHIDAGLRRTIVALPADQCVRVRVNYNIHLFPAHLATLLSGHSLTPFHDVVLFGEPYGYGTQLGTHASTISRTANPSYGPLLTIDFTSQGGGLYVRDYPNNVDPSLTPQWPGFATSLEPRPHLNGEPHKLWKPILAAWHRRLLVQEASQRQYDSYVDGPCVPGGITPAQAGELANGATAITNEGSTTGISRRGRVSREHATQPTGSGL